MRAFPNDLKALNDDAQNTPTGTTANNAAFWHHAMCDL
jgi:hypothetical protein